MSARPVVYVPQHPSRYDTTVRMWVPAVNLAPAERFGTVQIMFPPNVSNFATKPLVDALKERMENYSETDYLIAIGDPGLIACAACIAARKTGGRVRLLKWDKRLGDYIEMDIRI